jgi:hypothetical protein
MFSSVRSSLSLSLSLSLSYRRRRRLGWRWHFMALFLAVGLFLPLAHLPTHVGRPSAVELSYFSPLRKSTEAVEKCLAGAPARLQERRFFFFAAFLRTMFHSLLYLFEAGLLNHPATHPDTAVTPSLSGRARCCCLRARFREKEKERERERERKAARCKQLSVAVK